MPDITTALPRAAGPPPTDPSGARGGGSSQLPLILGLTLGLGGGLLVLGLLAAMAVHRGLLGGRGGGWGGGGGGGGGGRKRGFEKFEEGSAAAAVVGQAGSGGGGDSAAQPSVSVSRAVVACLR